MENRSHALAAGLFVIVVAALLAALGLWLTRDRANYTLYELSSRESVSGLQPQAAVRYKGVAVGRVERIGFDPQQSGNVLIRIAVNADAPVSATTYATLGYQGVTGLAHVLLDDAQAPLQRPAPGASGLPRLPLQSSPFSQLAEQGPLILARVQEATERVNRLLSDDNLHHLDTTLTELSAAVGSVGRLARGLDDTVRTGLAPALAQAPAVLSEARQSLAALREASDNTAKAAQQVGQAMQVLSAPDGVLGEAARSARALTGVTERVGRGTLVQVDRAADAVTQAARGLGQVASGVGENPQSLLYGAPRAAPGPGEPGFVPPPAAR
ncbi:MAG: MlaD family protein [Comamonadaceae bacterium]|nr:MlaD family protein [Burkholderiales bacterium]MEB2349484.1 MlaD family protein [Comamonadaceae bacterium]